MHPVVVLQPHMQKAGSRHKFTKHLKMKHTKHNRGLRSLIAMSAVYPLVSKKRKKYTYILA